MSSKKNIIKSKLTLEKYHYDTLIEVMIERLKTDQDKGCLIDCSLNRKWTKKQVLDSSLNFAYYLVNECGLKAGDIVCFVTNNSDIHAMAILGVLAAGGVYSSLPEHSTEREIREVTDNIKPTVLVCFGPNYQTMSNISKDYSIKHLVIDEQSKEEINESNHLLTIEKILENNRKSDISLPVKRGLDDYTTILMSSGSTGRPKAILRTNRNDMANCSAHLHKELCPLKSEDIFLGSGFCHGCGRRGLFFSIISGAQLAIIGVDEEHDDTFVNIHEYNITTGFIIPTQLNFLAKYHQKYDKNYLKSLRDVFVGGSLISESTYKTIVDKYNFDKFRHCYGMSEIGASTFVYNSDSKCLKSTSTIGKLCPGFEGKIMDEQGNSLGPNEQGQLCFRADQVTPGYLNNDEENAKLFTSDGFLKTGDYGYYDENQFFYIIGRYKEIIKVEGVVVSPSELERILIQNNEIENAAVIGIKDEERGEIPLAFVALVKGSTLTEKQIQDWFDSRVNYWKKLRGGVRIVDKFPLTPLKKISKMELKKLIPELL